MVQILHQPLPACARDFHSATYLTDYSKKQQLHTFSKIRKSRNARYFAARTNRSDSACCQPKSQVRDQLNDGGRQLFTLKPLLHHKGTPAMPHIMRYQMDHNHSQSAELPKAGCSSWNRGPQYFYEVCHILIYSVELASRRVSHARPALESIPPRRCRCT